ncbi:MAG: intermembrane transport protein PqiB [Oceanospirillaceae bacterium]
MTNETSSNANSSTSTNSNDISATFGAVAPLEKRKSGISIIWFIPLLAIAIGGWMFYQQWENRGIEMTVSFDDAEGLEAGKTKVKSRNVDIGILTGVSFNQDRTRIIASVEIAKSMGDFLRADSQFWIVKPRIGTNGISGIGTILSGAYIEVYPGTFKKSANEFVGLERPPITEPDAAGLHLTLLSKRGTGLSVGDPIIYRGFSVGRIQTYSFDTQERQAKYDIFIEAPYDSLVTSNSHFWNVGGISLESNAQGFKLNIATVETLISGGVQFDIPDDLVLGEQLTKSRKFKLYDSEQDIVENREYQSFEYAILVDDSVRGLYKGAPVEYRGVRVGTVISPYITPKQVEQFKIEKSEQTKRIPLLINIEPQRLLGQSSEQEVLEFNEIFKQNIKQGLTANIETANLLTGSLLINLDFNGEAAEALDTFGPYVLIPSTREGLAKIQDDFEEMLDSFNKLPLDQLAKSASDTLITAGKTLKSLRSSVLQLNRLLKSSETQQLSRNLNKSMLELQKTLKGLQPDSNAYRGVEKTMFKLQKTLDSLQPMLKKISNNPSTLIFGTPRGADLQPRKK